MVMESACRVFAAGAQRSKLALIAAFYGCAPDFRNRSSWGLLHEDDPRRFRKFRLATLIDDFAEQLAHAARWSSGAWVSADNETQNSENLEKENAPPAPKLPAFPWRRVAAYVLQWRFVPPTAEHWVGLEPELQRQVAGAWRSLTEDERIALQATQEPGATP
jgi:hypothetical protein